MYGIRPNLTDAQQDPPETYKTTDHLAQRRLPNYLGPERVPCVYYIVEGSFVYLSVVWRD